ncbi:MAG: CRISPR-associated endonuclease Cas2 [Thiomicrospira sp.]
MMVLITYDISFDDPGGQRRLRHIAKACLDYGVRVQYSVFECELDPAQWVVLKAKLLEIFTNNSKSKVSLVYTDILAV